MKLENIWRYYRDQYREYKGQDKKSGRAEKSEVARSSANILFREIVRKIIYITIQKQFCNKGWIFNIILNWD